VGERFEVEIEALAYGGDGVSHAPDGRTLFVPHSAPGDRLEVEIRESHQRYARAKVERVLSPGAARQTPSCPVAGQCGGCQWQHLDYSSQLQAKENFLVQSLRRLGGLEEIPLEAILPSPQPFHYRNKAIVPFATEHFGFYREGSHEIVPLPQEGCGIQSESSNLALLFLQEHLKGRPEIKHALVRSNNAGEVLIALVTASPLSGDFSPWLKDCKGLKGVVNNLQPKAGNTVLGRESQLLCGEGFLEERIEEFRFRLSASSFFQVNSGQIPGLWNLIHGLRTWSPGEKVLEIYSGIGTLSLPMGQWGADLLGVESWQDAVADARDNARLNQLDGLRFECQDATKAPELFPEAKLILVDPPRKGMERELLEKIGLHGAKEFIYVSCDPSSLARDLKLLLAQGWHLKRIQALDMFPQTYHVESVSYLQR
jgi:23S rRNA (uracil1939-C5)-methyltransferase